MLRCTFSCISTVVQKGRVQLGFNAHRPSRRCSCPNPYCVIFLWAADPRKIAGRQGARCSAGSYVLGDGEYSPFSSQELSSEVFNVTCGALLVVHSAAVVKVAEKLYGRDHLKRWTFQPLCPLLDCTGDILLSLLYSSFRIVREYFPAHTLCCYGGLRAKSRDFQG